MPLRHYGLSVRRRMGRLPLLLVPVIFFGSQLLLFSKFFSLRPEVLGGAESFSRARCAACDVAAQCATWAGIPVTRSAYAEFLKDRKCSPSLLRDFGGSRVRVLFFSPRIGTDSNYMHLYYLRKALERHPCFEVFVLEHGYHAGYDLSLPVWKNVENIFGPPGDNFDFVFLQAPTSVIELGLFQFLSPSEIGPLCEQTTCVLRYMECWDHKCLRNVTMGANWKVFEHVQHIGIHLFAYGRDVINSRQFLRPNSIAARLPWGADPEVYLPERAEDASQRPVDVLVCGSREKIVYPLRRRISWMVAKKVIPGVARPPGGRFHREDVLDLALLEKQNYSAALRSAKIVVATASRLRLPLAKYVEAAMAGALVIGDVPLELADDFRQFVVELQPSDDETKIKEIVSFWLSHNDSRAERARAGQQLVLARYSWDKLADTLLNIFVDYKQQRYGYALYHGSINLACAAVRSVNPEKLPPKHANEFCLTERDPYQVVQHLD